MAGQNGGVAFQKSGHMQRVPRVPLHAHVERLETPLQQKAVHGRERPPEQPAGLAQVLQQLRVVGGHGAGSKV